jgi:hypothetical protein
MSAIEACRTAALGGHVAACRDCGYSAKFLLGGVRNFYGGQAEAILPIAEARRLTISGLGQFRRSPSSWSRLDTRGMAEVAV